MIEMCAGRRKKRRGATLVEATVAIAIASTVLVGVTQLLVLLSRQCGVSQRRAAAVREAGNLMEDLMSRPWSELTEENAATLSLSDSCRRDLPDARLRVDVTADGDAGQTRRIAIEIDWLNVAGQRGRPVRLVAWRTRMEEASP